MIHNNTSANIKVAVRMRPPLPDEEARGQLSSKCRVMKDINQIQVVHDKSNGFKAYRFDKVFNPSADQQHIFEEAEISGLIKQVVQGFHATIFVYGQTGSGKTFTMEGYKYAANPNKPSQIQPVIPKSQIQEPLESEGVIPRSIRELFEQVNQKREEIGTKIHIYCSYIQLYNEKIYDLLNSDAYKIQNKRLEGVPGLKLKWTPSDDVQIENLFCFECPSIEDGFHYFWKGLKNKIMASHRINNSSSRSHCILTFTVNQIDINNPENVLVSKLQLVDLAGSERQSQANSNKDPQLLKEAIEINKSLFTLRQVISALTENNNVMRSNNGVLSQQQYTYVPYRESKLTSILRQSLGGNSYTLMIACLSPLDDYIEENFSTLNYASRASNISNIPTINQDPKLKFINEQKRMIERLQLELKRANDQIKFLTMQTTGMSFNKSLSQTFTNQMSESVQQQQESQVNATSSNGGVTINNNYNSNLIAIISNDGTNNVNTTANKQINVEQAQNSSQLGLNKLIAKSSNAEQKQFSSQQDSQTNTLPELRSNSRIWNSQINHHAQQIQDQIAAKQKQMSSDFQTFIQNKSDALKNLSSSVAPMMIPQQPQLLGNGVTDRLIFSINMIKELLQSNLQLREDLLKLQQEHEKTSLKNYQFTIENEDLRDQLQLMTNDKGFEIEYQQYLPQVNLDLLIEKAKDYEELSQTKRVIMSCIYTLRKENRQLLKRLDNIDKQDYFMQIKMRQQQTESLQNPQAGKLTMNNQNDLRIQKEEYKYLSKTTDEESDDDDDDGEKQIMSQLEQQQKQQINRSLQSQGKVNRNRQNLRISRENQSFNPLQKGQKKKRNKNRLSLNNSEHNEQAFSRVRLENGDQLIYSPIDHNTQRDSLNPLNPISSIEERKKPNQSSFYINKIAQNETSMSFVTNSHNSSQIQAPLSLRQSMDNFKKPRGRPPIVGATADLSYSKNISAAYKPQSRKFLTKSHYKSQPKKSQGRIGTIDEEQNEFGSLEVLEAQQIDLSNANNGYFQSKNQSQRGMSSRKRGAAAIGTDYSKNVAKSSMSPNYPSGMVSLAGKEFISQKMPQINNQQQNLTETYTSMNSQSKFMKRSTQRYGNNL